MPVLASSAFLETQAVISSLPPSQHNFSKNPPGPLPPPPPLAVYALTQAASMTPHISLLDRNPFLNN
ncbi:hypothetical protein M405DRAFT_835342, partial [Rhizopogon salebrosus TDB-379]